MREMGTAKQRLPGCSHITSKGGLRDLCFISLVKRQTGGNLIAAYNSLKVSYEDDRAKVFVVVAEDITRPQIVARDIQIREEENFSRKVMQHWDMLPSKA